MTSDDKVLKTVYDEKMRDYRTLHGGKKPETGNEWEAFYANVQNDERIKPIIERIVQACMTPSPDTEIRRNLTIAYLNLHNKLPILKKQFPDVQSDNIADFYDKHGWNVTTVLNGPQYFGLIVGERQGLQDKIQAETAEPLKKHRAEVDACQAKASVAELSTALQKRQEEGHKKAIEDAFKVFNENRNEANFGMLLSRMEECAEAWDTKDISTLLIRIYSSYKPALHDERLATLAKRTDNFGITLDYLIDDRVKNGRQDEVFSLLNVLPRYDEYMIHTFSQIASIMEKKPKWTPDLVSELERWSILKPNDNEEYVARVIRAAIKQKSKAMALLVVSRLTEIDSYGIYLSDALKDLIEQKPEWVGEVVEFLRKNNIKASSSTPSSSLRGAIEKSKSLRPNDWEWLMNNFVNYKN